MAADCQPAAHKPLSLHIVNIYWYLCSSQLSHLKSLHSDYKLDATVET